MTNEQALLALLRNRYDKDSLAALAANNAKRLGDIISHWFVQGLNPRDMSVSYMIQRIAVSAKLFSPRLYNPDKWIEGRMDMRRGFSGCSYKRVWSAMRCVSTGSALSATIPVPK